MRPDDSSSIPELVELASILDAAAGRLESRVLCSVRAGDRRFPVIAVAAGNPSPEAPAAVFVGGVHGLERIGAEVVLAHLRHVAERLRWDRNLHRTLECLRLVFLPVVNPGGIWRGTRANPNGVDLMRNAPVTATGRIPFLIGGQSLGPGLPWYRGGRDGTMEDESAALCRLIESEILGRPFSIAIDCHSGFGLRDRIWFPYACTPLPVAHLAEIHALTSIFERSHVHHPYAFEPQSRQYLAHGDLWDHLYRMSITRPDAIFLPFTLEMGSWLWVRKNPRQLFHRHGLFNPLVEHRQRRVLRRHLPLLEFMTLAAASHECWLPRGEQRTRHRALALDRWYRTTP
ncbi:MAG TPA: M14 family zinc carboxypeptidase [Rhodocyclaceae bacterium]|nr:M14 family zinc carboxypeptidase [Rhodocyclaceae bacterium]